MTLLSALRSLSGTKKDAAGAANAWAGTAGLELLGALNAKAGTKGLGLGAVARLLTGGKGEAEAVFDAYAATLPPGDLAFWGRADETALTAGAAAQTNMLTDTDYESGVPTDVGNYFGSVISSTTPGYNSTSALTWTQTHATNPMGMVHRTPVATSIAAGTYVLAGAWVKVTAGRSFFIIGASLTVGTNTVVNEAGGLTTNVGTGDWQYVTCTPFTYTSAFRPALMIRSADGGVVQGTVFVVDKPTVQLAFPVSTFTDQSAKGWNMTQPTGTAKPLVAINAVNGKPALRFVATSQHYLTRTASMPGFLNAARGYTVVAACAVNTTAATQMLHFVSGGVDNTQARARASFSTTNRYPNPQARNTDADASPVTSTGTTGSNANAGQWQISTQNVDWESGTISAYKNGALVLGPSAVLTPGSASPTDVLGMRIGCQSTGTGLWLDGMVAEILVYQRTLSAAERSRAHAYLSAKYAIAVS